jgi:protein translocase SecG subunit
MYLDFCLRLWATLAQAPTGVPVEATPAAVSAPPPPVAAPGLSVIQYLLMAVYLLVSVGLIAAVVTQSSKNEGLGGMLGGGSTQSVFQGKKSTEEMLGTATNYLAVSFIVLSMVVSMVMR